MPSARDPYFLYAASNVGSMIALLGYPFVFEPVIGEHVMWWAAGYVIFALLTAICAMVVRKCAIEGPAALSAPNRTGIPLSWRTRLEWVFLSFEPSSRMLGVTTHISTDTAVPLLWVLPLAIISRRLAFSSARGASASTSIGREQANQVSMRKHLARRERQRKRREIHCQRHHPQQRHRRDVGGQMES